MKKVAMLLVIIGAVFLIACPTSTGSDTEGDGGIGGNGGNGGTDETGGNGGSEGTNAVYPGFEHNELYDNLWVQYQWEYKSKTNGEEALPEKGSITITFRKAGMITIGGASVQEYTCEHEFWGDDPYPLSWPKPLSMAVYKGAVYFTDKQPYYVAFDPVSGSVGKSGFSGYLADNAKTFGRVTINNPESSYWNNIPGVKVSNRFYKPKNETIAGHTIYHDEGHDYTIAEYYIPEIGFCGFTRSGTSIFGSGMYTDTIQTELNLWLSGTNISYARDPFEGFVPRGENNGFNANYPPSYFSLPPTEQDKISTVYVKYCQKFANITRLTLHPAGESGGTVKLLLSDGNTEEYPYEVIDAEFPIKYFVPDWGAMGYYITGDLSLIISVHLPEALIRQELGEELFNKVSDITYYLSLIKHGQG